MAECHLASESARKRAREQGTEDGEAGADLVLRRDCFFAEEGVGVPALAAAIARGAADTRKAHDAYVAFLHTNADLIGDLRRRARLTACAPRVHARESEVRVTGSRGERLLGGTDKARATVLGSELEQAERALKRQKADLKLQEARVADLRAKRDANEAYASEVAGGRGPPAKKPRGGA